MSDKPSNTRRRQQPTISTTSGIGGGAPSQQKRRSLAPVAQATDLSTDHPADLTARLLERAIRKIFVLDTNVFMHDPTCLWRFAEHDICLPMGVLEELDHNKKGMDEKHMNARQAIRFIEAVVGSNGDDVKDGCSLAVHSNNAATGRLFLQTDLVVNDVTSALPQGKVDNQILSVVADLKAKHPDRQVILVTKDINMRIKARALDLKAQDYFNDKVLEDTDLLYGGVSELPLDFWSKHSKGMESWQHGDRTFYRLKGPLCSSFVVNQFVYQDDQSKPFQARVIEVTSNSAVFQTVKDYTHHKNKVWGISARNREQNFALNVLMDPEIDFVSLLGQAGTGKTLLTLAAALTQVLEGKTYSEIIMTRVTVPVGEDIGFLPGTEEEKMIPWMGALEDNLEVLTGGKGQTKFDGAPDSKWGDAATNDVVRSRIKVRSLNFMRGRTFINKFLIIDEAQNLTSKQMKTLITRAGPGTKVVCLGNIAQIDTPYLTEGSSGITYVVDRFKGWGHGGHITLARGERSRLADYAAGVL